MINLIIILKINFPFQAILINYLTNLSNLHLRNIFTLNMLNFITNLYIKPITINNLIKLKYIILSIKLVHFQYFNIAIANHKIGYLIDHSLNKLININLSIIEYLKKLIEFIISFDSFMNLAIHFFISLNHNSISNHQNFLIIQHIYSSNFNLHINRNSFNF